MLIPSIWQVQLHGVFKGAQSKNRLASEDYEGCVELYAGLHVVNAEKQIVQTKMKVTEGKSVPRYSFISIATRCRGDEKGEEEGR